MGSIKEEKASAYRAIITNMDPERYLQMSKLAFTAVQWFMVMTLIRMGMTQTESVILMLLYGLMLIPATNAVTCMIVRILARIRSHYELKGIKAWRFEWIVFLFLAAGISWSVGKVATQVMDALSVLEQRPSSSRVIEWYAVPDYRDQSI